MCLFKIAFEFPDFLVTLLLDCLFAGADRAKKILGIMKVRWSDQGRKPPKQPL